MTTHARQDPTHARQDPTHTRQDPHPRQETAGQLLSQKQGMPVPALDQVGS